MITTNPISSKKITIRGIVQGVGFRPFIYKLAKKYRLVGEVYNSNHGVSLIVEGTQNALEAFVKDINIKTPPIAKIDAINVKTKSVIGFNDFKIATSKINNSKNSTIISPDISICNDCLIEIKTPKNRRYHYPFTNCTNCGPRYTIIKDIPYDRKKTSMSTFNMCDSCQTEYDNPLDRRFHAQPNACKICGPNLKLVNSIGIQVKTNNPILSTSNLIKNGYIIAIKGLGGFHLVVDATNNSAVLKLRKRKNRPDKPFAIMSKNINVINSYSLINIYEKNLLKGTKKPIVLLKKKNTNIISKAVSPRNRYLGVMLPYTPLHYLLLNEGFIALVMTSGNINNEPISIENRHALTHLRKIADYFLLHNRDILIRSDDSISRNFNGKNILIRRSRGYAPEPISIPIPIKIANRSPSILSLGAETKNTICISKGRNAFISQHIGDLKNKNTYDFFIDTIKHMQHILKTKPKIIACDYHPDYLNTRYALSLNDVKIIKVQHHHAHIAGCMAENFIEGPVIGLALDGSGFGNDGTIWGGEVLITNYDSFKRVAFLEPIQMPGGSIAIKEPWRMGISYLNKAFGEELQKLEIPLIFSIGKEKIQLLLQMINKKINTPYTSSLGRLFDATASIIGIRNKITFEGQAAIELETLSTYQTNKQYDYYINQSTQLSLITSPIIKNIIDDIRNNTSINKIATKFHNTITSMFVEVCIILKKRYGIKTVALSGGVFQNFLLLRKIERNLKKNNFNVLYNQMTPFNDAGISFGQAVVAAHLYNL